MTKRLWRPSVVTLLVAFGEAALHAYVDLPRLAAILIPILAFVLTKLIDDYFYWKPIKSFAEQLLPLRSIPGQLTSYVHQSVSHHLMAMQSLSHGGVAECTYAEQITIADNLVGRAKNRLWATTLDTPSRIWDEGYSYFQRQEGVDISDDGNDPPPKARLVALEWNDLRTDFVASNTRQSFERFVEWHDANNYGLRFLLDNNERLRRTINILHDSQPIMDFIILNNPPELVYGRLSELPGNRASLRFIARQTAAPFDSVDSYETTFVNWWKRGIPYREIRQRLRREADQPHWEAEVQRDYGADFVNYLVGREFFGKICNSIRGAKKSIFAVDIADTKESVDLWSFKDEYLAFSQATGDAASAGEAVVERVFVVKALSCMERPELAEVLRNQIAAGIKLHIIEKAEVDKKHLAADDFILIDDALGFYLGSEAFDMAQLSVQKNLIPKARLQQFRRNADALKAAAKIHLASLADLDARDPAVVAARA
jgi:hypothetical protein